MLMNEKGAFEYIKKIIVSKGFHIRFVFERRNGRHLLIQARKKGSVQDTYFYCLFKHAFVDKFNLIFNDWVYRYPEYSGYGESINIDCCDYAKTREAYLLYIYPEGEIYSVSANWVYKFCNAHSLTYIQKRTNYELVPFGYGEEQAINEEVYMFPINAPEGTKQFERFY